VQRADQAFVDRCAVEGEGVQVLDHRRPGRAHAVADRSGLAVRRLGREQIGQDLGNRATPLDARGDRSSKAPAMPFTTTIPHSIRRPQDRRSRHHRPGMRRSLSRADSQRVSCHGVGSLPYRRGQTPAGGPVREGEALAISDLDAREARR